MTENEQRASVVAAARSWLGTPYHHMAGLKGIGADCGQFIAAVFHEVGLMEQPQIDAYPRDWMCHRTEERFREIAERYMVRVDRPARPGDILLFRYGRTLSHGGIVVDYPVMVHALVKHGVVYGSVDQEPRTKKKLAGTWTLKGWT